MYCGIEVTALWRKGTNQSDSSPNEIAKNSPRCHGSRANRLAVTYTPSDQRTPSSSVQSDQNGDERREREKRNEQVQTSDKMI